MDAIEAPQPAPQAQGRMARAKEFLKMQAKADLRSLFAEGIAKRTSTLWRWGAGAQLITSGWALASEAVTGSTWTQVSSSLKSSLFLDDVAGALLKDGQAFNNADAYTLMALMAPSVVMGIRKGGSARIGNLIRERSEYDKATGNQLSEYEPTAREKIAAYAEAVLGKIPRYLAAAYTATLLLKTDLTNLGWMMADSTLNPKLPAAIQAVQAVKDSFSSMLVGTALGVWAIYKGITMYYAKDAQK